jgi:hypothetical protein
MFTHFVANNLLRDPAETLPTGYTNLEADTLKAALFNNSITPDKNATGANTGFDAGQWDNVNEVSDGTNWDAGGEPLTGKALTSGTGYAQFDATDTPQSGASTTLANVYGALVYDDSTTAGIVDQGVSYHYFGGAQSVTAGTFTIVWHANGLFRITT